MSSSLRRRVYLTLLYPSVALGFVVNVLCLIVFSHDYFVFEDAYHRKFKNRVFALSVRIFDRQSGAVQEMSPERASSLMRIGEVEPLAGQSYVVKNSLGDVRYVSGAEAKVAAQGWEEFQSEQDLAYASVEKVSSLDRWGDADFLWNRNDHVVPIFCLLSWTPCFVVYLARKWLIWLFDKAHLSGQET